MQRLVARGVGSGSHDCMCQTLHAPICSAPSQSPILCLPLAPGHGYDPFGCGEFCTTVHWFAVNGKLHSSPLGPRPGSNYGARLQFQWLAQLLPSKACHKT